MHHQHALRNANHADLNPKASLLYTKRAAAYIASRQSSQGLRDLNKVRQQRTRLARFSYVGNSMAVLLVMHTRQKLM